MSNKSDFVPTVLSTIAPVESISVDIINRGGCCSVPELTFVFGSWRITLVHVFFVHKVPSVQVLVLQPLNLRKQYNIITTSHNENSRDDLIFLVSVYKTLPLWRHLIQDIRVFHDRHMSVLTEIKCKFYK